MVFKLVKKALGRFSGPVKEALGLFAIATLISIVLTVIAEVFCEEDGLCDNVLKKIAEAFGFIAAASLTGAVYIIISEYKQMAKKAGLPDQEIKIGDDIYELRNVYMKK